MILKWDIMRTNYEGRGQAINRTRTLYELTEYFIWSFYTNRIMILWGHLMDTVSTRKLKTLGHILKQDTGHIMRTLKVWTAVKVNVDDKTHNGHKRIKDTDTNTLSSQWGQKLWWGQKGETNTDEMMETLKDKSYLDHMVVTMRTKTTLHTKKGHYLDNNSLSPHWSHCMDTPKALHYNKAKEDNKSMNNEIKMRTEENWIRWWHCVDTNSEIRMRTQWRNKSLTNNYVRSPLRTSQGICEGVLDILFLNTRKKKI